MPSENYLKITTYGAGAHPACVLLSQHGDDGSRFVSQHPEITAAINTDSETLHQYIAIEHDFGITPLAHQTAQEAAKITKNRYRLDVVEALFPRAILDANRIPEYCVRNIFRKDQQQIIETLRGIYTKTVQEIDLTLKNVFTHKCFFLNIHSMSPYSPAVASNFSKKAPQETPETLADYINHYTHPAQRGDRRFLDVITKVNDSDAETVDNEPFREALIKRLDERRIAYRINHPYTSFEHTLGTTYSRMYKGATIDIPKDYLARGRAEDANWDLTQLEVDSKKVENLSSTVALAIADRVVRH